MQTNQRSFIETTLIMCAILAAICISAGVIAIFAQNWDDFPKPVRLIFSFMPIGAGIAVFYHAFFNHNQSKVWMESAAAFLVLMVGSSVSLVTQLYHIGDFNQILLVWMLLSLPILYLANSSAVTIIYLAGITWWLVIWNTDLFDFFGRGGQRSSGERLGYWLLLAAVIPHFMKYYKGGIQTLRTQILGWFSIIIVLYGANLGFVIHNSVGYSLAISLAYVLGKELFPHGRYFWNRPFQTVAVLAATLHAFFLSNNYFIYYTMMSNRYMKTGDSYLGGDAAGIAVALNYVLLVGFLALIAWFYFRDWNNQRILNPFIVFFPVVVIIGLLLAYSAQSESSGHWFWVAPKYALAKLWFNLFLLAFCAWYLYKGITMRINGIVTYAIFMLSVMLMVRYIDTDMNLYLKGLLYMAIGGGLLYFNKFYTSKALAEEENKING